MPYLGYNHSNVILFLNLDNFLEFHNITPIVKDQQRCGCCWSHASTSALGYRYNLKGLNLSLSPQNAVSCYTKDCNKGIWGIDAEMNLVKNGTVTEECLPFTSGNGTVIDKCPAETEKCADGVTKPKKYISQKAYYTSNFLTQESYYDIVTLIILTKTNFKVKILFSQSILFINIIGNETK